MVTSASGQRTRVRANMASTWAPSTPIMMSGCLACLWFMMYPPTAAKMTRMPSSSGVSHGLSGHLSHRPEMR